jgi:hypothetical protein
MRTAAADGGAGRVAVFGSSDDLLEFEGAIYDEVPIDVAHQWRVAFSHGPVLVLYSDDEGFWRWRLQPGDVATGDPRNEDDPVVGVTTDAGVGFEVWPARGDDAGDDEDHCPGYSDKVVLNVPDGASAKVTRL